MERPNRISYNVNNFAWHCLTEFRAYKIEVLVPYEFGILPFIDKIVVIIQL